MDSKKVSITINPLLLDEIDELVGRHIFPNRSQMIQTALEELIIRFIRQRLAQECAKLNPDEEKRFAEMGIGQELSMWPDDGW